MIIKDISNFKYGLIDKIEDNSAPRGAATGGYNWTTQGDHIELRRGFAILGDQNTGAGRITGLHVAYTAGDVAQPFRARGQKLEYLNLATSVWTEIGSNI